MLLIMLLTRSAYITVSMCARRPASGAHAIKGIHYRRYLCMYTTTHTAMGQTLGQRHWGQVGRWANAREYFMSTGPVLYVAAPAIASMDPELHYTHCPTARPPCHLHCCYLCLLGFRASLTSGQPDTPPAERTRGQTENLKRPLGLPSILQISSD